MRPRLALASAAAALATALVPAAPASAQLPFAACSPAGFECTTLAVPLDHSGQTPGTLSLSIERVRASSNPTNTAVVALAGGPGQAAIPLASDFAQALAPAITTRDLVVFDQRGTGSSGALDCPAFDSISADTTANLAARCANEIGPRRAFFRTADSVDDLEAIRQAAGYDKLVLYGVSYGTKVALDYAAKYPAHVQSLVLDSVVTPDGPDVLRRSTFAAIGRVIGELCGGGACRSISPSTRTDLARFVHRLQAHSLRGAIVTPGGSRLHVAMDETGVLDILLGGDLNPALRAELPGSVRSALRGDSAPILRLFARAEGLNGIAAQIGGESDSAALFATTRCEESAFPWDRAADPSTRRDEAVAAVEAIPSSVFAPFDRPTALASESIPICIGWPDASPAPAPIGPLPAVPTLILTGGADLRTPVEDAQRIAAQIPGAQVAIIPHTGHSVLGSDIGTCARTALANFFAGVPIAPCSEKNDFAPTPVAPTSLARVRAHGRTLKTVRAVLMTVLDVSRQFIGDALAAGKRTTPGSAVGGLRSGHAVYLSTGISFRRVVYVPGVTVSGFLPFARKATARFTVSGKSVPRGRVAVLADGEVLATLGGRRVHVRPGAARAARAGASAAWSPRLPRWPALAHSG
ncbi:MAG TPA: alpha/beta fold hydrolase [Solirubrobacteraceae bacterium]|nr:alpha/beta fold hydrolase [Solirubrobacteraceae bacterium]